MYIPDMPPPTIYISSTFRDLKAYREKMLETLRFLIDGYFVVGRTMETMMPGSQQPPLEECLRDVANCNIYVLIFGKRYGSIAPGTDKSFTEHEYLLAKGSKTVLAFYADSEAEGLADIDVDNKVEFERFKNTVQQAYTRFPDDFTTPANLSLQMMQALFKISGKKWPVQNIVKYCCDRDMPYYLFKGSTQRKCLNIPVIISTEDDKADYFILRMAKYVFGLEKQYVEKPLSTSDFIGSVPDYETHELILRSHLMDNFVSTQKDIPKTIGACCKLLVDKGINNIFIKLYLTTRDIGNPIVQKTLKKFFTDLNAACVAESITLFYVVIFEFDTQQAIEKSSSEWFTKKSRLKQGGANVYELKGFEGVSRKNVNEWAKQYIYDETTAGNELLTSIETFLTRTFPAASPRSMKEAFFSLNDLIKLITQ